MEYFALRVRGATGAVADTARSWVCRPAVQFVRRPQELTRPVTSSQHRKRMILYVLPYVSVVNEKVGAGHALRPGCGCVGSRVLTCPVSVQVAHLKRVWAQRGHGTSIVIRGFCGGKVSLPLA